MFRMGAWVSFMRLLVGFMIRYRILFRLVVLRGFLKRCRRAALVTTLFMRWLLVLGVLVFAGIPLCLGGRGRVFLA